MITLTQDAAQKIFEIAKEEGVDKKSLRVKVIGGGCSGFSYDLFFEENDPLPMDETFVSHGVTIVVDPLSFQYLDGSEIIYVETYMGAGFKFINPNITSSCACGSSVAF